MKLSAIIKELQKIDKPKPTKAELTAQTSNLKAFNEKLLEVVRSAIAATPGTKRDMAKLIGTASSNISLITKPIDGRKVSATLIIKIMLKLGYDVEIKFTRIEK